MWSRSYEQQTDLSPDALWSVLADIAGWAQIDENIKAIEVLGTPGKGTRFFLTPKGGPRLAFVVSTFEPPCRYADSCSMPLARMTTLHTLVPTGHGTLIKVEITIEGPLAGLWGQLVGKTHHQGLPAQTARFIDAARVRAMAA